MGLGAAGEGDQLLEMAMEWRNQSKVVSHGGCGSGRWKGWPRMTA